jgi:hypothetical protein
MTRKYRVVGVDKAYLENLLREPKRKIRKLVSGDTRQVTLFDDDVFVTSTAQDHVVLTEGNHDVDVLYLAHHGTGEFLSPPRVAQFLLLLIPLRQREHLLGDLEEEFRTTLVPGYGLRCARIYYYWQVWVEIISAVARGLKGVVLGYLFSKITK